MKGLPDSAKHNCNTIAVDPANPHHVFLAVSGKIQPGKGGPYWSSDGGKTWNWFGRGLPQGSSFYSHSIWESGRELAVAPGGGQLLTLSRGPNRVFRYDSKRQKWVCMLQGRNFFPFSLVADALSPETFYLACRWSGLRRTEDGGLTWKTLWEGDVSHLAVDAARPRRIAAGTENGVIVSVDGGREWSRLAEAMPYRVHNIPAFAGDRLIAGSTGSGAFWAPLNSGGLDAVAALPVEESELPPAEGELPRLRNLAMSEGGEVARFWTELWTARGKVAALRDTETFAAGPASLRLETVGGSAVGSVKQTFPCVTTPFIVQGSVRCQGDIASSFIAVRAADEEDNQLAWIPLANIRPSSEWRTFSGTIMLPDRAKVGELTLSLDGDGAVWLDEVTIRRGAEYFPESGGDSLFPASNPDSSGGEGEGVREEGRRSCGPLIENGSMEIGKDSPVGWTIDWKVSGEPVVSRDTAIFKEGLASLRLSSGTGTTHCTVGQMFEVWRRANADSRKLRVRGNARCRAEAVRTCQVAIQFFDDAWKQCGWRTLRELRGSREWNSFDSSVDIPPKAVNAKLLLLFHGNGNAWLDGLSVE